VARGPTVNSKELLGGSNHKQDAVADSFAPVVRMMGGQHLR
jgi:hypothetical protein